MSNTIIKKTFIVSISDEKIENIYLLDEDLKLQNYGRIKLIKVQIIL